MELDETLETTEEAANEIPETDSQVGDVSADPASDISSSGQDPVESEADSVSSDTVISFPDDYLDTATFNAGVDQILTAIEGEPELFTGSGAALATDEALDLPWNAVVFTCNGVEILFPSDYAQEVYVDGDQLVNTGISYTFGAVLGDSGLGNYVSSEITVPTYHSSTWYQYLYNYGQPYKVVDRYVNSNGSYSSSTRTSVDLTFSGGNDWAGWGYGILIGFVILILLVLREVRTWLT